MNVLSWNCRGFGNPRAIRNLYRLVKDKKPAILFLMETKCSKNKMETVRIRMGFEGLFVVEAKGHSGGLALLWKESGLVDIQNYTRMHINVVVNPVDGSGSWRLTGFYGQPDWTR